MAEYLLKIKETNSSTSHSQLSIIQSKIALILLFFILFSSKQLYCQKNGTPGTLKLIHINGKYQELPIGRGIAIRLTGCDSISIDGTNYGDVTSINLNGCDTNKTPVINNQDDLYTPLDFSVFPNPNNGNFTVQISSKMFNQYNIDLINLLGEVLESQSGKISQGYSLPIELNLNLRKNQSVSPGVYYIRLTNHDETITKPIVITH